MEKQSRTRKIKDQPAEEKIGAFFGRQETEIPSAPKSNKRSPLKIFMLFVILLMITVVGFAVYYYNQYQKVLKNSITGDKSEMQSIVATVGKFIELPGDEEPTLATVTDVEKIKSQAFFAKAENGDKVLFYTKAAQAILFRPSTGKVINMTIVSVTDEKAGGAVSQGGAPVPEATTTPPAETLPAESVDITSTAVTVALYNGSSKVGVTNTLETQIMGQYPSLIISMKEKAAKSDYTETQVIDLSGKNADFVTKLAEAIGGKVVATLPEGEVNPGTDILVIAGQK